MILKLGENISRLRHEKKMTQEEIADFTGVTKASVSKWENNQSLPDITMLPTLATLFDVTVDELLGYESQPDIEQIRTIYSTLADSFAKEDFDSVYTKVTDYVNKYYNCYKFILYMCILMINHVNLVKDEKKLEAIMAQVQKWCRHIVDKCKNPNVITDASAVSTLIDFMLKRYQTVIANLEEAAKPNGISRTNDILLTQTYAMLGDIDNTEKYGQIYIYNNLTSILTMETLLLSVEMNNRNRCEETISRMDSLIAAFDFERASINAVMQYYYQAAIIKALYNEGDAACDYLEKYCELGIDITKHPDKLFDFGEHFARVSEWLTDDTLGMMLPRDRSFILTDLLAGLEHPLLQVLSGNERFEAVRKRLKEED